MSYHCAYLKENEIKVTMTPGGASSSSIVHDETLIGTLGDNDDVFALYGDKLNSYKYTFNYENGNYYFSSVELVK